MLTVAQKTLVQDSFASIATIADDAAVLFYQRLFELDPSLQPMFRGRHGGAAQEADADAHRRGEGARPPRAARAGRPGSGTPPRRLRRRRVALRHGRRGAAVDARDGARQRVHARSGGGLDRRVRPAGDDDEGAARDEALVAGADASTPDRGGRATRQASSPRTCGSDDATVPRRARDGNRRRWSRRSRPSAR